MTIVKSVALKEYYARNVNSTVLKAAKVIKQIGINIMKSLVYSITYSTPEPKPNTTEYKNYGMNPRDLYDVVKQMAEKGCIEPKKDNIFNKVT